MFCSLLCIYGLQTSSLISHAFWCYYKCCHSTKFYFLIISRWYTEKHILYIGHMSIDLQNYFISCNNSSVDSTYTTGSSNVKNKSFKSYFPISIPSAFSCLIALARIGSISWIEIMRGDILIPILKRKGFNIWPLIMMIMTINSSIPDLLTDFIMTGCQIYEMIVLLLMRRSYDCPPLV